MAGGVHRQVQIRMVALLAFGLACVTAKSMGTTATVVTVPAADGAWLTAYAGPYVGRLTIVYLFSYKTFNAHTYVGWISIVSALLNAVLSAVFLLWIVSCGAVPWGAERELFPMHRQHALNNDACWRMHARCTALPALHLSASVSDTSSDSHVI